MVWRKRLLILVSALIVSVAGGALLLGPALGAVGVGQVELCGHGRYTAVPFPFPRDVEQGAERAVARLVERLLRSDLERDRARGLFLSSHGPRLWELSPLCIADSSRCADARSPERAQRRRALAELAERSRDPAVYALALLNCEQANSGSPACARLTYAAWAERDPLNRVAWMGVRPGDGAAERRAWLARIAEAKGSEPYTGLLFSLLAEPELREVGQAVRTLILLDFSVAFAPAHSGSYGSWGECREGASEPGIRQVCERIAERLVNEPGNLLDFMTGRHLGKQMGWSEARIAALREESSRLQSAAGTVGNLAPNAAGALDLGCGFKDTLERFVAARTRMSEVEYARKLIADGALPAPPSATPNPFGRAEPATKANP